jgi:succinyl-CoA synthetase beta subunit
MDSPLVLKVDSPGVPHRTDADAVRTDVRSKAEARDAYEEIVANTLSYAPEAEINSVLVQPQVSAEIEALVGMTRDDLFGPLVTVGSGGTLVELADDNSIRIPPFTLDDARDAIEETHLSALLSGHRGGPSSDIEPLADIMQRIGQLAREIDEVAEIDLNPIVITEDGVSVVDALVRTG